MCTWMFNACAPGCTPVVDIVPQGKVPLYCGHPQRMLDGNLDLNGGRVAERIMTIGQ